MEDEHALFHAYLTEVKMRFTSVRRAILDAIIAYDGNFTVRDVLPLVKVRNVAIDRASLYRNFLLLMRCGIIEKIPQDEDTDRGFYRMTRRKQRRYQLYCPGCQSAEEVADEALDDALRNLCERFQLNFDTLQLRIEARHLHGRHPFSRD